MRMDICLCSDNNYAKYMGTTIASILSNSKEDEEIYFHLIVDNDVTDDSKNKLLSLKKIKNCEMKFYTPDVEKYKKWFEVGSVKHLSAATFYRLDIHRLIQDIDKVLYLDCDIIVNDSLKELFEIDINNYYIITVKDIYFLDSKKDINESYFNSGVILVNSKLWLESNVSELFENYYLNNYKNIYGDQDILNYCLKEKVKYLDNIWNYFPLKSLYDGKPIKDIKIPHYAAAVKPWNDNGRVFYFADEFWKYYQLTPWFLERPIDAIQTILAQKYGDYEETKLKINDVKCFGIYHNRNTLEIVIFFIKIRIEMSFKNINKIAWFIPVKKWREAFKRAFDI
ncbi:glycosyltransferase family 8 protein [Brachyspira innocens]|uniref:glycosyltransferase family 8 protein n=1 Tax=Brachyspira innocens TaxID=13264 RepID=UPI0026F26FC8|nr:glycosyltransferase family 8 protein [Brachyspira innocens]